MAFRRIVPIVAAALMVACGASPFGDDRSGAGNISGGAGGTPTFEADCGGGPLDTPIPNCAPETLATTGDPAQDCVNRVNQLRWECQCLPPLDRWIEGEACAGQHAEYDTTRDPHAGFSGRICSPGGWAQNECPGWRSIDQVVDQCLQAMWDEGPGPWGPDHGHYINMTNPDYAMVACGFHETGSGQVWAVQNFQ